MPSVSDTVVPRIRWSGALVAAAALVALVGVGPPGNALAATAGGTGYDQITGAGSTASALTVSWAQGLLDNTNTPIAAANAIRSNPTGPLTFMYQDPAFQNLQVTVSQTQDITHQGITVTWKGGAPTIENQGVQANFLQLMECYGDASTGPSPQDCEFGSLGLLRSGSSEATNVSVGSRAGNLCVAGAIASTASPPSSLDGTGPVGGCDPQEPADPSDIDPANPQNYTIPFVPVTDPGSPAYGQQATAQYFNQFNSNEVQATVTGSDGTGQLQFETLTGTEAPGLGCGESESTGQTRNCWLVIVPRGEYEPNGRKVPGTGTALNSFLYSSPLSASNWAMRIQIHLDYAPVGTFCPIGTQEIQTVGTQVAARAVQSWQLALNQAANCSQVYGYTAVPEATSTQQLALSGSPAGLAFTTIPIGSEATRPGGSGGAVSLPSILYAPVAVTAVGFGFNINQSTGYLNTPINLTPELLAKALTQVYRTDLPDYDINPGTGVLPILGPSWSQSNPENITKDPEFGKLNPDVVSRSGGPFAPLLTEDHSALNQQIWQWIQADPAASGWLNQGTADATNAVTADPDYLALNLGTAPAADSFPRAYSGSLDLGQCGAPNCSPPKEETRHSLDLLPYVSSYDQAASSVLTAVTPGAISGTWDFTAIAPDGTLGWWLAAPPGSTVGSIFSWGIADTPDLAAYGLIDAQLCDDAGNNCVGPSTASLTTALASAKPDSAGLLQVNPANPGSGGYPLVQVTYAAVDTTRGAADLTAYADLIAYAAGAGQTPGVAPGDLPPGYLPMPASLKAQAMTVVAQLREDAGPSPSGTSTTTTAGGTGQAGGSGSLNQTLSSANPSAGPGIIPPRAQLAAARTGRQPLGAIRWALLAVVIAGAACAVGGTVLRTAGRVRWLRRMRS